MRVIRIPADGSPLEEFEIDTMRYPALNEVLKVKQPESEWIERVVTPHLHQLAQPDYSASTMSGGSRFPSVAMIVDEEGRLKGLPWNVRAGQLYDADTGICGDALLVGEDEVFNAEEGYAEEEFTGLPEIVTLARVEEYVR